MFSTQTARLSKCSIIVNIDDTSICVIHSIIIGVVFDFSNALMMYMNLIDQIEKQSTNFRENNSSIWR